VNCSIPTCLRPRISSFRQESCYVLSSYLFPGCPEEKFVKSFGWCVTGEKTLIPASITLELRRLILTVIAVRGSSRNRRERRGGRRDHLTRVRWIIKRCRVRWSRLFHKIDRMRIIGKFAFTWILDFNGNIRIARRSNTWARRQRLCSVIHCEYSISIMHVTYAIDFEHSQWISERTQRNRGRNDVIRRGGDPRGYVRDEHRYP